MFVLKSLGTHDGTFHADEVTASALLVYFELIDRSKIIRTREQSVLQMCEFVCDVGGVYNPSLKRFDHHQASYQGSFSSAGMVWSYLKEQGLVTQDLYDALNRSLVLGVDAHDNGLGCLEEGVCTFSHVISNFIPIAYDVSAESMERAFFAALDFVLGHLERFIARFFYVQQSREKVQAAMLEGKEVLFFAEPLPWMDLFFALGGKEHSAQFVIMPSGRHWKLRGIPPSQEEKMKVRTPLPQQWAGLLDKELQKVTGIAGAVFCHKGQFISVWQTKEDAMQAVHLVLNKRTLL